MIDRSIFDLYADTPDGKGKAQKGFEEFRAGQEIVSREMQMQTASGATIWVSITVRPVRDADGKVLHSRSMAHNISERKRAEEELVKFKLGMERSTDAFFMTTPQGVITYTNPAFEKIYGYAQAEAIGQTPRILKSGQSSPETYQWFWGELLKKNVVAGEIINKTKDGCLVNIDGANNPIVDGSGQLLGFLGIHRDITARKKTEQALAEERNLLRSVIDFLPYEIFMKDLEGRYIALNQMQAHVLGVATPA